MIYIKYYEIVQLLIKLICEDAWDRQLFYNHEATKTYIKLRLKP
jgi:hypothetical protein